MAYFYIALVTILVLCVPLSCPCVVPEETVTQSTGEPSRWCAEHAPCPQPKQIEYSTGAFSSACLSALYLSSAPLCPPKLLSLWPDAGFSLWQWMAGGPPGASGLPVGRSAHTGAGGSARRQPPRTEARTATVWSCNPRTALMDFACRVSLWHQRTHWGDLRFNCLESFAGNIRN